MPDRKPPMQGPLVALPSTKQLARPPLRSQISSVSRWAKAMGQPRLDIQPSVHGTLPSCNAELNHCLCLHQGHHGEGQLATSGESVLRQLRRRRRESWRGNCRSQGRAKAAGRRWSWSTRSYFHHTKATVREYVGSEGGGSGKWASSCSRKLIFFIVCAVV